MEVLAQMFRPMQVLAHQAAVVPVIAMLALVWTRSFTRSQWMIAFAFAVSWVADSVHDVLLHNGYQQAVEVNQVFVPIQLGLMFLAVAQRPRTLLLGLAVATIASAMQPSDGYELVVPVIGGLAVSLYAWHSEPSLCRMALLVYFGAGSIAWAVFAFTATEASTTVLVSWYAYQVMRLVGLSLMTASVVFRPARPHLRLVRN